MAAQLGCYIILLDYDEFTNFWKGPPFWLRLNWLFYASSSTWDSLKEAERPIVLNATGHPFSSTSSSSWSWMLLDWFLRRSELPEEQLPIDDFLRLFFLHVSSAPPNNSCIGLLDFPKLTVLYKCYFFYAESNILGEISIISFLATPLSLLVAESWHSLNFWRIGEY